MTLSMVPFLARRYLCIAGATAARCCWPPSCFGWGSARSPRGAEGFGAYGAALAGYSLGIVALTDIDNVPKGVMLVAGETASVTVGPSVATDADGTRDLIARLFSP